MLQPHCILILCEKNRRTEFIYADYLVGIYLTGIRLHMFDRESNISFHFAFTFYC